MAPMGLILLLLGAPTAATPSWCFTRLEEDGGGGACAELLIEERVPLADCCLNPAYGYKLRPLGHCFTCRAGAWGPWGPWGGCSVSCGAGTQRRGRGRRPGGGGAGEEWELRVCERPCCPEEGAWSPWSPWGPCSVTCGGGTQGRSRKCDSPAPRCGGGCGPGGAQETRMCQEGPPLCPVGGAWGPWGPWGGCGGTCRGGAGGGPTRSRSRFCDSPPPSRDPPGPPCPGGGTQSQPCPHLPPCPEDGSWGAWSSPPCAVTCGLGAVTQRRACDAPPPRHGGRGCPGNGTRRALCGPLGACPEVPRWGPWGPWSPCKRPWENIGCRPVMGQQRRTRECVGRRGEGPPCPTDGGRGTIELRTCYNIDNCLLDGNWSDWSPWGLCTPPCGASPTRSRFQEWQPVYPNYTMTSKPVTGSAPVNVTFWGRPRPKSPPRGGQKLRPEETQPCPSPPPCPPPEDD